MDTELNLLVYPQKPLLMTRTIELVGYDKLGAGQNATVAVMSFSGYDMGDAIVMNKASLERGFGRCTVMRSFSTKLQSYEYGIQEKTVRPCSEGSDTKRMQLDMDGLPAPGEIIKPGDIVINKQTPKDTWNAFGNRGVEYKDTPVTFNGLGGEPSVVDKVARFSDFGGICGIKYLMRQTRQPEVGDQFSSRHGQKGVCGAIIQQEDFPFSERGICPDLIINPHAFPSGMTVGSMIELLGAKARVSVGGSPYNGSAFEESSGGADKVEEICKELVKKKFSYSGKEFLYSGITGSCLQAYVFMGPIYYQTLRHMVMDKMHSSYQSKPHQLTRQPTYRSDQDGVRVGENERNCLTAHGASMVIFERLMLSSDVTTIEVCGVCGSLGYYNRRSGKKICSSCQKETDISTQKVPYACKLLIQELQSMNISMKLKLAEEEINDDLLNHVAVNEF
ncbi:DNA-directed RNA polymerase, subunit [Trema orientale]|uniref:DNA-directed RNA polymerase n=1 Tax=Trema orientale TaxID=63057 RepID=A0A2P5DJ37_TREOI|nr:DNA-directed RNA polymerase, subunit [Trema orientale]